MKRKVFLGGTCNNSVWREELIPRLNIDYFNPVVKNWTPKDQAEERKERNICSHILYVITSEMKGVFSIAEAVEDSIKRPNDTIFCVLEERFDKDQIKSLNATKDLIEKNGAYTCNTLEKVIEYLNN